MQFVALAAMGVGLLLILTAISNVVEHFMTSHPPSRLRPFATDPFHRFGNGVVQGIRAFDHLLSGFGLLKHPIHQAIGFTLIGLVLFGAGVMLLTRVRFPF